MSDAQFQSYIRYAIYTFAGALIATGLQLAAVLPGDDPIPWRALAGGFLTTFLGALATAWGTSKLPRAGSEDLAADVDDLRKDGVSRRNMKVVRKNAEVDVDDMTPAQRRRLAVKLKAEMMERPAPMEN